MALRSSWLPLLPSTVSLWRSSSMMQFMTRHPSHAGQLLACILYYAPPLACPRSHAGEDVVPTFTTSNDRMLLLLSSGQSGMLRIEDAERLQVCPGRRGQGWGGGLHCWCYEEVCRGMP